MYLEDTLIQDLIGDLWSIILHCTSGLLVSQVELEENNFHIGLKLEYLDTIND